MKPRHLLTYLLCAALIFGLFGCSKEKPSAEASEKPAVKWEVPMDEDGDPITPAFDTEVDGCHITGAVLMKDGVITALTKKDLIQTFTRKTEGKQNHKPKDNNGGFIPQSLTKRFVKNKGERITRIFERAATINFEISMKFECTLMETDRLDKEEIDQESVDETVMKVYGLRTKGSSYTSINEYEGLAPSEDYKYAVVMFIPEVAVVKGKYKTSTLTYHYPCVNDAGYLNGIFLMIQSDNVEVIPD